MQTLTRHERYVHASIRENGLRIEPVGDGGAVRVVGPDVYVLAAALRHIHPLDLTPYRPIAREDHQH